MARPAKWRCLECLPGSKLFGPVGVPARQLEKLRIAFDELEALRLLHLEGVTQAEAGSRLGVSASTVSRMADRAHRVITEALVADKGSVCGRRTCDGGPGQREFKNRRFGETANMGKKRHERRRKNDRRGAISAG